jgi:hypothetical protein
MRHHCSFRQFPVEACQVLGLDESYHAGQPTCIQFSVLKRTGPVKKSLVQQADFLVAVVDWYALFTNTESSIS